jgi:uncharacterized protein
METILITGGTGLVGTALTKQLTDKGYAVIIITRENEPAKLKRQGVQYAKWDIFNQTIDIKALQDADHIIHLAGAGVMDKRWTGMYKKAIIESRALSSSLLFNTLSDTTNKIKTVVSASAIGWYGKDIPGKIFEETDPPDKGFLGDTCRIWEASIGLLEHLGKRVVKLRTGIVLSNDGGALVEFKKSLHFNIAAILGNGKQMISWIHIDDLCRLYIDAIENKDLIGSYNAVSPEPVSNEQLILELAKKMKGRFFIKTHVPEFVLKLMLGEQSIEILKSCTVSCKKIEQAGFSFLYPSLDEALSALFKK